MDYIQYRSVHYDGLESSCFTLSKTALVLSLVCLCLLACLNMTLESSNAHGLARWEKQSSCWQWLLLASDRSLKGTPWTARSLWKCDSFHGGETVKRIPSKLRGQMDQSSIVWGRITMDHPRKLQTTDLTSLSEKTSMCWVCNVKLCMGVSENSVPLNPMVNDHYPY